MPVRVDFLRLVEDVEGQESYHDLEVPDDSFAALLGAQTRLVKGMDVFCGSVDLVVFFLF